MDKTVMGVIGVTLVLVAVVLHLSFCTWMIYGNGPVLLWINARPGVAVLTAQLAGIILPMLIFGAAVVVFVLGDKKA